VLASQVLDRKTLYRRFRTTSAHDKSIPMGDREWRILNIHNLVATRRHAFSLRFFLNG